MHATNVSMGQSCHRIKPGTTVSEFKANVQTMQNITITDKEGKVLGENEILATGMTLQVGSSLQFTLAITGDIDGNGQITLTDLAKLKLHYINKKLLTGVNLKAADLNGDDGITITDLAKLKLVLINLKEIE